jgi:hypothetical protein
LQREIGGEIVFFYHDSDHDPRETNTILHPRKPGLLVKLNFAFANRWQRKFSPLYVKRVLPDWQERTALQLRHFVDPTYVQAFKNVAPTDVGSFCLEMYRQMGLLEGIRVVRSSDPAFRQAACDVSDFFVDVPYEGEIVRARFKDGTFTLHEGGNVFVTVPPTTFNKEQISPARDERYRWMQSVLRCTHYVAGAGEQAYLRREDCPEITIVNRDEIERADDAYTDLPA